MRSDGALARGSARVSRAGYGVSLHQTSLRAARVEKSAIASTRDARATRRDSHRKYMMRRLLIYVLLIAGSLLFAWPFIWMAGTSVKLEREVLSNRARAFPERPIPRVKSPYLDDRLFSQVTGPHRDKAIA